MHNNVSDANVTSTLVSQIKTAKKLRQTEHDPASLKSFVINEREACCQVQPFQTAENTCTSDASIFLIPSSKKLFTCKICLNRFEDNAHATKTNCLYQLESCKCKFCLNVSSFKILELNIKNLLDSLFSYFNFIIGVMFALSRFKVTF